MIRLRTLGALDLHASGGEELRAVLAQPRRAALLAYLALAMPRGTQRRDTVLALFWPELDVDRARNALGQAVHFLRRSIGAGAVVSRNGDGLAVDWSDFWCDAAAFEEALDANRIGEALALYRGDLLEGFHIDDAPEFDRWLESERARLAARYTKAVETLASDREGAGDFHGAATHWRVLTARDPYSSRLTVRLMRALISAGDPASALEQARQHERLLREELAIAPDAEVTAMVRQLQSEQPAQPSARTPKAALPANNSAGVTEQPVARESPRVAALPRRRTATLMVGLLVVCAVGVAAVLKSGSRDASAVPTGVAAETIPARGAASKEAYLRDLLLRGRNAELSRSELGLATARAAYERAIAEDPNSALGYAALAGVVGLLGDNGFAPLRPAKDTARMLARRAFMMDSTLSETRTALAVTLADAGEFQAAEREFKRAIVIRPSDTKAHYQYTVLLTALGRGADAKREVETILKLDPVVWRGVQAQQRYAHWLVTGERPYMQLPVRERRPSLKLDPGDPWAVARQAEDLALAGECGEARADMERAQRLAPDNVKMRLHIGRVELPCGGGSRARALLDDMKRRPDAKDNGFQIALFHMLFDEKDSAFAWLEGREGWRVSELSQLSAAPYLDPLRSNPRYLRLQRRLGVRD